MAILDDIEVHIKVPSVGLALEEFDPPVNNQPAIDPVPWVINPLRAEKTIIAPPGQIFTICIRLPPSFDFSLGDGLHITLRIDDGAAVYHHYSIKFTDLEMDHDGWLMTVINSAILSSASGFRRVLFSFANLPAQLQALPFGYYDSQVVYPEGRISVSVIRVAHFLMPPKPATITYPDAENASLGAQGRAMRPISLESSQLPMVFEHALPVGQADEKACHFVFHYKVMNTLIMDSVTGPTGISPSPYGGSSGVMPN